MSNISDTKVALNDQLRKCYKIVNDFDSSKEHKDIAVQKIEKIIKKIKNLTKTIKIVPVGTIIVEKELQKYNRIALETLVTTEKLLLSFKNDKCNSDTMIDRGISIVNLRSSINNSESENIKKACNKNDKVLDFLKQNNSVVNQAGRGTRSEKGNKRLTFQYNLARLNRQDRNFDHANSTSEVHVALKPSAPKQSCGRNKGFRRDRALPRTPGLVKKWIPSPNQVKGLA